MTKIPCNTSPPGFGPYFADAPGQPFNYHLFVWVLPLDVIDRLTMAARHYAVQVRPNPLDNRGDNMNYPVRNKERVNLIRHCLVNRTRAEATPRDYPWGYDNLLFRIAQGGQDILERQLDLKLAILAIIRDAYPELADECRYQRWQLLGKPTE